MIFQSYMWQQIDEQEDKFMVEIQHHTHLDGLFNDQVNRKIYKHGIG